MSDEPEQKAPELPEGVDTELQLLCLMAEQGVSFPVTLFVGGAMITGQVISAAQYHRLRGQIFSRMLPGETGEMLRQGAEEVAARLEAEFASQDVHKHPLPHRFIHLKDAQVVIGPGQAVPNNRLFWRGKLVSVDGFSCGEMRVA